MNMYTLIAGVNGVGKSSLTGVLSRELHDMGIIVDADKIAAKNHYSDIKAGRIAIQTIRNCIEKGISFTQETTLSSSLLVKNLQKARDKGFYVRMYYIGLDSAEESIQRIQNRVKHGGHDISSDDVNFRFHRRIESLLRVLPYCHEVTFFDNNNGFVAVAEYKNGAIHCFDNAPNWIKAIQSEFDR